MCLSSIEKAPKPDLQILQRFKNLNALYIQNLHKNLDKALTQLPNLTNLTLRSVSQPKNLQCMAGLSKLQSLTLQICSFEDISTIAELKNIRYLQL